ncbi:hypothetical protein [Acetobacter ascendens]|uniref:Uncharacterized protein n=1 Tax=Acetobacter ascendens TaxID=481146 RepID=A0A1D8QTH0_9PROT|nr:hypothetical protein [Acetobacter ascendens]AOW45624.1 hypothetical protein A4S02_01370 [Acetobacter ascendens]ARW09636.1 hypothetical protein S101447_00532 [Acetobacter ascendens]RCL06637.1 hypothetical protein BBA71_06970 [Acetobacter pasteurianus]GCD74353.1 hypothetical protein NBRC3299_0645 [Acetobacter pasteurianus NBRC 3299]
MIPDTSKPGVIRRTLQGMLLLASGRRDGMACFDGTLDAFGAALAPQLAFLVVGLMQVFLQTDKIMALIKVLLSLCVTLLPAVVSHFYAQRWGRGALWLRYITAATWCNWVVVLISLAATLLAALLFPAIAQQPGFMAALVMTAAVYELWLQWFVARVGLSISGGRAFVLYASVLLATLALYGLAALLPPHYKVLTDLLQPMIVMNNS